MIVVYGLQVGAVLPAPVFKVFKDIELTAALSCAARFRSDGLKNVSISSEPGDLVGSLGVDSVEDGTLPDGHHYEWSKRRGDPRP